ncbi:SsgA family sporulation/cell division regulator [Streptomyces sp. NPDC053755]|uniref:SsgA family sporulation/cell division regulator n=1 Tax=Streptomyces sp. NPDC053755 TaxID=3155815 RepID=UPI003441F62B
MPETGSPVPPPSREIKWKATAHLVAESCRVPLPTTVRYRSRSPFTLQLTLHTPTGDVVWNLERDMLFTGTDKPTGIGEVHIRPAPYDQVVLRLGAPSACALITFERGHVLRWLSTSYTLVPAGTESDHIDWKPFLDVLAG